MLTRQENQLRSTSGKVYFFLSKKLLAVHQPRDLESLDQAHLNIPQFTWRAFCGRKSQRSLTLFPQQPVACGFSVELNICLFYVALQG